MKRRARLKCAHGKCKYDCHECGICQCLHHRRKRDCQQCQNKYAPMVVQILTMEMPLESRLSCDDTFLTIVPIGCRCPSERKARSDIIGCGIRYGCNHDTMACSKCQKTHRYKAWALTCCQRRKFRTPD